MTHYIHRPPCQMAPSGVRNRCAEQFIERNIYGVQDLQGPWGGWRLTSDAIVTPERIRIRRDMLRFLIARELESGVATHPKRVRNFRRWEL